MRRCAILVVALVGAAAACGPTTVEPTTRPQPSPTVTTTPSSTFPSSSTRPTTSPTAAPVPAPETLRRGDQGTDVRRVQRRLVSLGYWLGTTDGVFGNTTEQAVYAIQKAAGVTRDGVVGAQTRRALAQGVVPQPRSASGHVVEIDLTRNLLLIVTDGHLDDVLNTSTGGGYTYFDRGVLSVARTPVGHFRIYWQYDGLQVSSLGELWRPKYFVGGYAIHGYDSVPPYPASHGCVRVSDAAIDWIWSSDLVPLRTAVWIY